MSTSYVITDVDSIVESLRAQGLYPNFEDLARGLRLSANFAAPGCRKVAYFGDKTADRAVMGAFNAEEFETLGGGAPRDQIIKYITDDILGSARDRKYNHLIAVTDDGALYPTINHVGSDAAITVRVWGTERASSDFRQPRFNFVNLQTQLDLSGNRAQVMIDLENVLYGMKNKNYAINNMEALAEFLKNLNPTQGHVVGRCAYADFGALAKLTGVDAAVIQRALVLNDIDVRYVANLPGKNSADMAIANDLKSLAQQPNSPDSYALISSDRDFSAVASELARGRKEVTFVGMRGSVSKALTQMPGVKVQFLDDLLPAEWLRPVNLPVLPSHKLSEDVQIVVGFNARMRQNDWHWITQGNAERIALEMGVGSTPSETRKALTQVTADGLLIRTQKTINGASTDAFYLNTRHPVVSTALTIERVFRSRIAYTHVQKGYPTVGETYILRGMEKDNTLIRENIKLSWEDGRAWLALLSGCGVLECTQDPEREGMRNYRLLEDPKTVTAGKPNDTGEMIKRLITAVDHYTAIKGNNWAPLMTMDRELSQFGRTAYFAAVDQLVGAGAATREQHPNNRPDRPPVTGLALKDDAEIVKNTRAERNGILVKARELHQAGKPISASALLEGLENEMDEPTCQTWLNILNAEKVLTRRPGAEATYALNPNHHLLPKPEMVVQAPEQEPNDTPEPALKKGNGVLLPRLPQPTALPVTQAA